MIFNVFLWFIVVVVLMIYILMTKRDYEEISRGEISSSFRRRDSNNFFEKSFKGNHPNAYRRREEELDRQDKLYEKYRNFRPSRILSGRELQEAIEICSEVPSRCFSFQETLAELGFHSLYSPQARLSSLKVSIERGGAILALVSGRSTISGGGRKAGGLLSATSDLAVAVGEGVVQLGSDTLHGIGGALSGIQDGVNAYIFDDKSIKESVEIMNKSSADYKDRHGYKLSEKSQDVVNQNPVVKSVNSALENTVGKGINYAQEQMNEELVFYAGSALGVGLDLTPVGGKAKGLFSKGAGIEKASPKLIDSISEKRSVVIAKEGSEEMRYLDFIGAEANVGGANMDHIILRPNPSKAAILEEFLHGTQQRLGIIDKLGSTGLGSAETHVKDFMIRHQKILGLSKDDVDLLIKLKEAGL